MPDSAENPTVLSLIVTGLHRVEQGITRVETAMLNKADKADMAGIEARMDGHATRISALERQDDLRSAKAEVHRERDERSWFARTSKWKISAAVLGLVTSVAIAAASVATALSTIH